MNLNIFFTDHTPSNGKICFAHCKKPLALVLAFWMFGDMVMDGIQNSIYWKLSPDWNPEHPMHSSQSVTEQYNIFCNELNQANFLNVTDENPQLMKMKDDWKKICSSGNYTGLVCAPVDQEFKEKLEKEILCQVRS